MQDRRRHRTPKSERVKTAEEDQLERVSLELSQILQIPIENAGDQLNTFMDKLKILREYFKAGSDEELELSEDSIKKLIHSFNKLKSKVFGQNTILRDPMLTSSDMQVNSYAGLINYYTGDLLNKAFESMRAKSEDKVPYSQIIKSLDWLLAFLNFVVSTLLSDEFLASPINKIPLAAKNIPLIIKSFDQNVSLEEYIILRLLINASENWGATIIIVGISWDEKTRCKVIKVWDDADNGVWQEGSLTNFPEAVRFGLTQSNTNPDRIDNLCTHYVNIANILGVIRSQGRKASIELLSGETEGLPGNKPHRLAQITFTPRSTAVEG